jgi:hypothetical protein
LASAEPIGDAALFMRAAALLGTPVAALGAAETAGMVEFGTRIRFSHPLMRSAAYRAADLDDRRAVHRVLAEGDRPDVDPDRRAWHAANAAVGPDDAVAAELEASAAVPSAGAELQRPPPSWNARPCSPGTRSCADPVPSPQRRPNAMPRSLIRRTRYSRLPTPHRWTRCRRRAWYGCGHR